MRRAAAVAAAVLAVAACSSSRDIGHDYVGQWRLDAVTCDGERAQIVNITAWLDIQPTEAWSSFSVPDPNRCALKRAEIPVTAEGDSVTLDFSAGYWSCDPIPCGIELYAHDRGGWAWGDLVCSADKPLRGARMTATMPDPSRLDFITGNGCVANYRKLPSVFLTH